MTKGTQVASDNGKSPAPAGLTQESRALWCGLRADLEAVNAGAATAEVDLVVLEQVLRARDRLQEVSEKLDSDGVTVTGSKDQVRPHPLLSVERALRAEVVAGLKQLGLTGRSDYRLRVDPNGRIVCSQRTGTPTFSGRDRPGGPADAVGKIPTTKRSNEMTVSDRVPGLDPWQSAQLAQVGPWGDGEWGSSCQYPLQCPSRPRARRLSNQRGHDQKGRQ